MSIDAMKQALEALIASEHLLEIKVNKAIERDAADAWVLEKEADLRQHKKAITSLRQAIEQAEKQEPVAYIRVSKTGHVMARAKSGDFYSLPDGALLYTTPQPQEFVCSTGLCYYTQPQREWVGLTPTDIADALGPCPKYFSEWTDADVIYFARTLDAKLKELNHVN